MLPCTTRHPAHHPQFLHLFTTRCHILAVVFERKRQNQPILLLSVLWTNVRLLTSVTIRRRKVGWTILHLLYVQVRIENHAQCWGFRHSKFPQHCKSRPPLMSPSHGLCVNLNRGQVEGEWMGWWKITTQVCGSLWCPMSPRLPSEHPCFLLNSLECTSVQGSLTAQNWMNFGRFRRTTYFPNTMEREGA